MKGRYVGDAGAYAAYPFTPLVDPLCAAVMLPNLYDVQAVRFEVDAAFTNKCPSGAYRGVGWTSGQTAREALVDETARELGLDPMELRLQNTIPDGEPYVSGNGLQVRRRQLRRSPAQGDGARRLRRVPRAPDARRGRRAATSASASARSSSRAAGPASSRSAWASRSTTWTRPASRSSPTGRWWSRSASTRTARRTRRRWHRSSPTSSPCRSRASRSSRATRRRPRMGPGRSAAAAP